ncbi:MAG: CHASE2 domain-containing protein [Pseudomonadota bacterium]
MPSARPRHQKPGFLKALTLRAGSLSAGRVTWALVLLFLVWVLVDVLLLKITGGLAQSSFDAMVRARVYAAAPDPRIVIVDIDEASLLRMSKEFGRWPWPRDTLATVLDHIEKQQPAAVVWDVVFSDADRLSPGGDAAFNAAALRSQHSHFSVVRLPPQNDSLSRLTRQELPGLWLPDAGGGTAGLSQAAGAASASTVALIAPVLPAVAAGRMGYNNGYVDSDGVLRRYRYAELLGDGRAIRSLALSVSGAVNPGAVHARQRGIASTFRPVDELVAWRKAANSYPLVPFADVFAQADGGAPLKPVPSFAGKVVIVGATAPSLHDVHPTPLSPAQSGVDSMATVIDNALNDRHLAELPRWLQALLAAALCVGIALWVRARSVASLDPALVLLPISLLGISYLSLNGLPVFVDLSLAAGLGLIFLAALRVWNGWRRHHWTLLADHSGDGQEGLAVEPLGVWAWHSEAPWQDAALDRLIDAVETHAPSCRVIAPDINATWPATLHWPELAGYVAITGPFAALESARHGLEQAIQKIESLGRVQSTALTVMPQPTSRDALCAQAMADWAVLAKAAAAAVNPPASLATQGASS